MTVFIGELAPICMTPEMLLPRGNSTAGAWACRRPVGIAWLAPSESVSTQSPVYWAQLIFSTAQEVHNL